MINLSSGELSILKSILKQYIPNYSVLLFGSRITAHVKPYSDIDLVIREPISADLLAKLNLAFIESDLPYKVDLVEWEYLSDSIRDNVLKDHVVLQ